VWCAVTGCWVERAAIFTADWSSCDVELIPPAVEDWIADANGFVGVELAANFEALWWQRQALVVINEAAWIIRAIRHD